MNPQHLRRQLCKSFLLRFDVSRNRQLIRMSIHRRHFLRSVPVAISTIASVAWAQRSKLALDRELGVTTGSFVRHLSVEAEPGKLRLLDLPAIMRDQLDMRV